MTNYPTQLDEIDQWLFDSFGIVAGACSSTENLRYNTAKMIAEALWPKEQDFTHHEADDSLQEAVTHQMEDEQVIDDYVRRGLDDVVLKYAQLGAKWQKEQDKETIELAEDHAMLAGMVKAEEQFKKDAIETTIINDWTYGKDPDHAIIPAIHQRIEGVKVGDKVKVYIFNDNKE